MVIEAEDPKYTVDGFFIREFKQLPNGLKVEHLLDEQKTFIFYLMATVPTTEEMAMALRYDREKQKILTRMYEKKLEFRPDVLEMAAKTAGISVPEYLERQRENFRRQDLKKLNDQYGIEDTDDAKIKNLERLKALSDQLRASGNNINKIREIFTKKDKEQDGQQV